MNTGAFGEGFPYTNFHDLNMDWIIKIAKDFLDQYTHIQEIISNGEESIQTLTDSCLEQLQNKADNLESLLQEWYETHSEDIANQLASALDSIATTLTQAINTFTIQANARAEQATQSIPSDYTELYNQVQNIQTALNYCPVKDVAPTFTIQSETRARSIMFSNGRDLSDFSFHFLPILDTTYYSGYKWKIITYNGADVVDASNNNTFVSAENNPYYFNVNQKTVNQIQIYLEPVGGVFDSDTTKLDTILSRVFICINRGQLAIYNELQEIQNGRNDYKNAIDMIPYFSNGAQPTINISGNIGNTAVVNITFPVDAEFRVYKRIGSAGGMFINTGDYGGQTFSIPNMNKLVADSTTGEITVTPYNTGSADKILLLGNSGGRLVGILADFYLGSLQENIQKREEEHEILSIKRFADAMFLLFSDVHAQSYNENAIFRKANELSSDISAVINCGDTVENTITDGSLDYYNSLADSCPVDVLTCAGNHDVWSDQEHWTKASKSLVYNEIIAPMVERGANIVQPSGASENYDLYYYKDYNNVRIIVLDAMVTTVPISWWDNTQLSWFTSVLTDARTNNKAVVCVVHPPFLKSIAMRNDDSNLNSFMDYRTNLSWDDIHIPTDAMDAVQTFINAGGTFVCWLSGHTHIDNLLTATGYEGQFMLNIASARAGFHPDGTITHPEGAFDYWYNCFDLIGIDLYHNLITVYRYGWNMDSSMRVRNRFSYNYVTKKIVGS